MERGTKFTAALLFATEWCGGITVLLVIAEINRSEITFYRKIEFMR
jgi:hypothetical protein